MRVLVNYVVQDEREHSYHSEILEISSPPYTWSADPPVTTVMKWVEKKQSTLHEGEKIIIVSMFNL